MLELLFVIGFFVMLMVTGVSLLGIISPLRCGLCSSRSLLHCR